MNLERQKQHLSFVIKIILTLKRTRGASHMHLPRMGLDILEGKDWDLDFEDYLGVPKYSTVCLNPVAVLETQYGMKC